MSLDPIEAFLSGIRTTFGRAITGGMAIFLGFGLDGLTACSDFHISEFFRKEGLLFSLANASFFSLFGIVWWNDYGLRAFTGLGSLIAMFVFLWAFIREVRPQLILYLLFLASAVYYCPVAIENSRLGYAMGAVGIVSVCYWLLPSVAVWLISRCTTKTGNSDR